MERACFLCGVRPEVLTRARWNLPLLPAQTMAYGVCPGCGLVMTAEGPDPETMLRYYAESAVYTNPGRSGRPAPGKVRDVARSLELVASVLGRPARSAFQVGASDGYTLSRFRDAGAARAEGVDPSPASCALARARYGIETRVGTVEDMVPPRGIELWIMTHVLEHLYDPLLALRRARAGQEAGAWLLVEVPLFERPELFPPGYLTFEHLSYFAEAPLLACLAAADYEAVEVRRRFAGELYPVITVLARAAEPGAARHGAAAGGPGETRRLLARYLEREAREWGRMQAVVHRRLPRGRRAYVWGAGIHSSQLFAATDIEAHLDIAGLLDTAESRQGGTFGPHPVLDPARVALGPDDAVVISSRAAEAEIWEALVPARARGVRVVRLYAEAAPEARWEALT